MRGHPAVRLPMRQGHLPVVKRVVGCERLSAPPHAGHVLLVEEDTLHSCKGQRPLVTLVAGGCTRAQGCSRETQHMPGVPAHPCQPSST